MNIPDKLDEALLLYTLKATEVSSLHSWSQALIQRSARTANGIQTPIAALFVSWPRGFLIFAPHWVENFTPVENKTVLAQGRIGMMGPYPVYSNAWMGEKAPAFSRPAFMAIAKEPTA